MLSLVLPVVDSPGRDAARELVREQLRRQEYEAAKPPLLTRLIGRVLRYVGDLLSSAVPGGIVTLVVLAVVLGLIVAVVLTRLGPLARNRSMPALFDGVATLTPAEHRRLAEKSAQDGRFADAVRERLRAIASDLETRGALDPRPGRTAGEVARDGGVALPDVAADLRRGAEVFDAIWYGGRPADAVSYAALVEVDDRVVGTRMALS